VTPDVKLVDPPRAYTLWSPPTSVHSLNMVPALDTFIHLIQINSLEPRQGARLVSQNSSMARLGLPHPKHNPPPELSNSDRLLILLVHRLNTCCRLGTRFAAHFRVVDSGRSCLWRAGL
jgi:hypothetical protein